MLGGQGGFGLQGLKDRDSKGTGHGPGFSKHGGRLNMADSSPITGVIDENRVVLDFGKYEGQTISDVLELDPDFYQSLIRQKESGAFAIRRHRDKSFRLYVNPLSKMDH